MSRLIRLDLGGFKSIRRLAGLELRELNVLIGANGAGKSNLISFFKLLSWMTAGTGQLQLHVGKVGGANALLHDGALATRAIETTLDLATASGAVAYTGRLAHAAPDTLVFADELLRIGEAEPWVTLGSGHRETKLLAAADDSAAAGEVLAFFRSCQVYQFHNTSDTCRMRQRWNADDWHQLKGDGGNLAPFLYRLRLHRASYYRMIVETLRLVAPFFSDFVLQPTDGTLILQWQEPGSDVLFGSHQASDGTLRTMALVALLLQPPDELPALLVLDEPELGLHPAALETVGGLLRSAALSTQVIVATQSAALVDQMDPEDVIVVERAGRGSTFTRVEPSSLGDWLQEYSLGELWEKNVLGGRP